MVSTLSSSSSSSEETQELDRSVVRQLRQEEAFLREEEVLFLETRRNALVAALKDLDGLVLSIDDIEGE